MIRALIVDDHGIVREGLELILRQTDDIIVVGTAPDGANAIRLFERLLAENAVDIVITDLGLPDIDGLDIVRHIKGRAPQIRTLILSMLSGDEQIRGMLAAGVDGYLLKQAAGQELAQAIRTVMGGDTALSPVVARRMMRQARRGSERDRHADMLSNREQEVLRLLADGSTSKEAARVLGLRTKTVENHRARILEKLQVTNTAAAIGMAYQEGILIPGHPDTA